MSNTGQVSANGRHPKATLEISGIPLRCDHERLGKVLEQHGKTPYRENVATTFIETALPERRIAAKFSGLSPASATWLTEVLRLAFTDCGYARFEIAAVLLRQ